MNDSYKAHHKRTHTRGAGGVHVLRCSADIPRRARPRLSKGRVSSSRAGILLGNTELPEGGHQDSAV